MDNDVVQSSAFFTYLPRRRPLEVVLCEAVPSVRLLCEAPASWSEMLGHNNREDGDVRNGVGGIWRGTLLSPARVVPSGWSPAGTSDLAISIVKIECMTYGEADGKIKLENVLWGWNVCWRGAGHMHGVRHAWHGSRGWRRWSEGEQGSSGARVEGATNRGWAEEETSKRLLGWRSVWSPYLVYWLLIYSYCGFLYWDSHFCISIFFLIIKYWFSIMLCSFYSTILLLILWMGEFKSTDKFKLIDTRSLWVK